MQLLDDRSAEALIGGNRHMAPLRQRFISRLNVNNVIIAAPQVAVPVSISIFGGPATALATQFSSFGITQG